MKWLLIVLCTMVSSIYFPYITDAQTKCDLSKMVKSPLLMELPSARFSGKVINVAAGGDLQSALNVANPGDRIVLEAGATFTGNFTLPVKNDSDYVYIVSSDDVKLPPAGSRIFPSFSKSMPKIVTPNSVAAIRTLPNAHHYWFTGIEFGITPGVEINYGIVLLGDGSSEQTAYEQVPHNIVIDRCYIHGNSTGNVSRGIALNSASTIIVDSYISNCHAVGFDSQAIAGWNGPGPYKIINNYLEGSGENVLFGGADPSIQGLVPSDIEFRRNYCFKPLSWKIDEPTYANIHWTIKNLFELKNAQRVLIEGNIFENNWPDGQNGFSILFTPRNQDGKAPWSVVQDIAFTNNIVRHVTAGINILGSDDIYQSRTTERIEISNNLFDDLGSKQWGGGGNFLQLLNGATNVKVDHNTIFHTGTVVVADAKPSPGFVYTNNISRHNEYGIFGSVVGVGSGAIRAFFPGSTFMKNVLIGGPANLYTEQPDNFFPQSLIDVNFIDLAGGNYLLAYNSLYKNAATNGKDLGADVDQIERAISGSNGFTPTATTSYSVVIKFDQPITSNTQLEYGTSTAYENMVKLLRRTDSILLDGLSSSTVYYYRIRSKAPSGETVLSNGYSFITLTKNPPVISKIDIELKPRVTIISWITDEPADTQLEYGTTTGYDKTLSLNPDKSTLHRVVLTDLLPDTTYHFRIKAVNSSGNLSVTSDQSFKTRRPNN